jgi:hypothetical protein
VPDGLDDERGEGDWVTGDRGTDDDLATVYDADTLAALDRWAPRGGAEPARGRRQGRGGVGAGALLAAVAFGLRDVLDGDDDGTAHVELDPGFADSGERWVTFLPVFGAPRASRIVIRPWLAPR